MCKSQDCRGRAGSIIAAIIEIHTATKNTKEPSWVATPMSIPFISRTAKTQHAAASPSVAVSAAAVVDIVERVVVPEQGTASDPPDTGSNRG